MRLAIKSHDEEGRKQRALSAARTEFLSKHLQDLTVQQCAVHNTPAASQAHRHSEDAAVDIIQERETIPVSAHVKENSTLDKQQDMSVSRAAAAETMEMAALGASLNSDETEEGDLVEALERVKLSQNTSTESKDTLNTTARENYFLGNQTPKKPHYLTILEKTDMISAPRTQKFRTNQWVFSASWCLHVLTVEGVIDAVVVPITMLSISWLEIKSMFPGSLIEVRTLC